LGWTPLAFAEIDAFPCAVLAHHYPDVPNHGDVTGFDWADYRGRCDMVVGGSPCQSFSVAGLRGSLSDDRGNLALAYCKIVHAIDPTYALYENVPGILNTKDNAFGCLLAGLVGEDDALTPPAYMGTKWPNAGAIAGPARTAAWRVLDAQFFGVAQRRRRVFVLTVRGSGNWTCAEALFPLSDGMPWDIAPSRETGSRIAASLTRGADSSGKGGYAGRRREDDFKVVVNCVDAHMGGGDPDDNAAQANHLVPAMTGGGCYWNGEQVTDTLDTSKLVKQQMMPEKDRFAAVLVPQGGSFSSDVTHALRADGFDASEDGTGRGTPLVPITFGGQMSTPQVDHDLSQTLQRKNPQAVAFQERGRAGGRSVESQTDLAYSLNAPHGGRRRQEMNVATPTMAVRRLTPAECLKLQGFPPDYLDITYRGKPAADGPKYRATGNSMCVNVVRWIGERIDSLSPTPLSPPPRRDARKGAEA
jgi:DNA (cytosine-5)-methyltransferase 1